MRWQKSAVNSTNWPAAHSAYCTNLAVTASARDEVSQRVAATLNEVHSSFGTAADQGLGEMREVAATLRGHSDNVVAADEGFIA